MSAPLAPQEGLHQRLIFLAPIHWHSFAQRPHELVECFHRQTGGHVLWVDPYPTRLPNLDDLARRPRATLGQAPIPHWLQVIKPLALPIEPLPLSAWLNRWLWRDTVKAILAFARQPALLVVGKPSHLALQLLAEPLLQDSCYDAMDDVSLFYRGLSRRAMAQREQQTALQVRRVWCSSSALVQRLEQWGVTPHWVANACAAERLPALTPHTPRQAPVIGYVGAIAKWFDWPLVIALARARPDAHVRLIGPVFGAIPRDLPANIHLLPQCHHDQAMEEMSRFDLGLIPFKINRLTDSVDPIKYYEYRALGVAVLSSAFGEMRHRVGADGVFLAQPGSDLPTLLNTALAWRDAAHSARRFRAENAWSVRFAQARVFVRTPPGAHAAPVTRPAAAATEPL